MKTFIVVLFIGFIGSSIEKSAHEERLPLYFYAQPYVNPIFHYNSFYTPIGDYRSAMNSPRPTNMNDSSSFSSSEDQMMTKDKGDLMKLHRLKETTPTSLHEEHGAFIEPSIGGVEYYPRIFKGSFLSLLSSKTLSFSTYTKTKIYLIPTFG